MVGLVVSIIVIFIILDLCDCDVTGIIFDLIGMILIAVMWVAKILIAIFLALVVMLLPVAVLIFILMFLFSLYQ